MNGFISKTIAGLALGSGLSVFSGCYAYRQCVDPCYPERYDAVARASVHETFAAQAANGHILDQTVWNSDFEIDPGTGEPTDRLTIGGQEHLKYISRRRPAPDPRVFLQTAQDVPAASTLTTEKLTRTRNDLDMKRTQSIQKFLAGQVSGRAMAVNFEVVVHDPAEVGISAVPIVGNQPAIIKGALPTVWGNAGMTVTPVVVQSSSGSSGGSSGGSSSGGGQ